MIHRLTISNKSERHLPAAKLSDVIGGRARDTKNISRDTNNPRAFTAEKMSSDDFVCSSVANRSSRDDKEGKIR